MDEGQGAHGQEARRAEGEKRDGRVALVGAEEPGAPGTVKPHRNLDEAAPEAPVRVGLAAPVPSFRADAELRGARELEVLPPQCVEHRHAGAPPHPDSNDHDGWQSPRATPPAWIENPLGVEKQEPG